MRPRASPARFIASEWRVQCGPMAIDGVGVTAMRKRLLWIGGLILCLAALALGAVLTCRDLAAARVKPGVTPENFARLYAGMSEREAEAILGRPSDSQLLFSFNHYSNWEENGTIVSLRVTDILIREDRQPSLIEGQLRLSDGTTVELRDGGKESPFDHFRYMLGLK